MSGAARPFTIHTTPREGLLRTPSGRDDDYNPMSNRDEANAMTTQETIEEIDPHGLRTLGEPLMTIAELAEKYGVSRTVVHPGTFRFIRLVGRPRSATLYNVGDVDRVLAPLLPALYAKRERDRARQDAEQAAAAQRRGEIAARKARPPSSSRGGGPPASTRSPKSSRGPSSSPMPDVYRAVARRGAAR